MLQRIEGLWSGFYTGLAVLGEDGCLRHAKTVGYSRHWLEQYRLDGYPGHVGLAHSRTNSGGGREWAHPFVSAEGRLALVAQGSPGVFAGSKQVLEAWGNRLLAEGRRFTSAVPKRTGRYPVLADDTEVHSSEIHEEATDSEYQVCGDHRQAVTRVGSELSSEAIYAMLFQDCADTLWLANVNQRCVIGFAPGEVFLATSVLAFPDRVERFKELPGNTVAAVRVAGVSQQPLSPRYEGVAAPPAGLEEAFVAYLAGHPGALLGHIVDQAIKPCYPGSGLRRTGTAGYRILEGLERRGRIDFASAEHWNPDGSCGLLTRLTLRG
ncbi:MAG: hypothetical protein PHC30_03970 [Lentisphaeria bacterium]|nr:hypothetical protein [Lentisphaeria bacterium]